jgi:anti-sigma B factor antagonist
MGMAKGFDLSITARPDAAHVSVAGEIDVASANELVNAVRRIGSAFDSIDFDLSGVSFMDAAGIRAFEKACEEAERRGYSYRVVALSRAASRVFALTGQNALLDCR